MIDLTGLTTAGYNDDRTKLLLKVTLDGVAYNWFVLVPPNQEWQQYLQDNTASIEAAVQAKVDEFNEGEKTTIIIDEDNNEIVKVLTIDEYVQPVYPDYFILRKNAYPSLGDQLDAIWKGGESAEEMEQKIQDVKEQYPKP